jgi:hypothetical protein
MPAFDGALRIRFGGQSFDCGRCTSLAEAQGAQSQTQLEGADGSSTAAPTGSVADAVGAPLELLSGRKIEGSWQRLSNLTRAATDRGARQDRH